MTQLSTQTRRTFAAILAVVLTLLCFTNLGSTVNAAADTVPKRTAPVLSSFDRNYVNYYNTINKIVASDPINISTPLDAVETYLQKCKIQYSDISGNYFNFSIKMQDFTCIVSSSTKKSNTTVTLRDNIGFDAVVVQREGDKAIIRSNDGPVQPWTKSLYVSDKSKSFTFKSYDGKYSSNSSDVATIITTIGAFYTPKSNTAAQDPVDEEYAKVAAYIGEYIVKHGKEAAAIREEVIRIAKAKGDNVTEADFKNLYASGQSDKLNDTPVNLPPYTQWFANDYRIIRSCSLAGSGIKPSNILSVRFGTVVSTSEPAITASFISETAIEIRLGDKVIKTIPGSRPSDNLILEFENSEFVNTNTVTLGIMLDRALCEYANA